MSPGEYKVLVALTASATLAGCAGSGVGLDANGQPIGSGGTVPLTADFQSIQANVFTPICTKCHIGAGAPEGLQLDAAHSYSLLVGVPSAEVPSLLRVKPGDPNNSYIILKLEGSSRIVGVRMPFGGPYLPQSTIDVIRQWITNGAAKSMGVAATSGSSSTAVAATPSSKSMTPAGTEGGSAPATAGFAVTVTSPANDAIVLEPVRHIVVAFNDEVDLSLVNDSTVSLERTPPDTTISTAMPATSAEASAASSSANAEASATRFSVSFALAAGNPSTVLITPAAPLGTGSYRVTLRGSGGGALADVNAHTLGADYSFVFTVDITP